MTRADVFDVQTALARMSNRVRFDDAVHAYYDESDVRRPSVTQVLKVFFPHTYARVPADVLERKRQIGSAVHAATHLFDRGTLDPATVADEVAPYLESWHRWCETHAVQVLATEIRLVHPTRDYAGTIDKLVWMPNAAFNGLTLVDLKTGDPSDARTHLQTAAYAELVRANIAGGPGLVPIRRVALQLRPDGALPMSHPYQSRHDWRKFAALRDALAVLEEEAPDAVAAVA